ncbi:hypothetical protein HYALB_00012631 [Hymenoscyphus albidus]|uniref:Enoyl reductase (ER) domain-containing protein n=1 Tax=Hymenoscyphus albidus TaxID=595503 RepID=A0A9N9Q8U0_9HELO|nr:hypothetical protein HYALB_00012631 [Hymenoscyphus albidus]
MKAIGVNSYGAVENLVAQEVPEPESPQGTYLLVQVKATSLNPIDCKIRQGKYDDAPDYYEHVPKAPHIIAMDGSGIVLQTGPECTRFQPGDEVFYVSNPTLQGAASELQLVDEQQCGHKPQTLDFVQAAAMPLTYATAYVSLVESLGIKKGEKAAILIINGAGGVGAVASQIARSVLELPVIITTASRPETVAFTKKMGATHVLNHRQDLQKQVKELNLDVPIKYVYILGRTEQYIHVVGEIAAPFARVCSIVQADFSMYGTKFMSKSMTFAWCWLGTRAYHGTDVGFYENIFTEMKELVDGGVVKCHLTKRMKFTVENLREAHRLLEEGTMYGKVALGVDEEGEGEAFT